MHEMNVCLPWANVVFEKTTGRASVSYLLTVNHLLGNTAPARAFIGMENKMR